MVFSPIGLTDLKKKFRLTFQQNISNDGYTVNVYGIWGTVESGLWGDSV